MKYLLFTEEAERPRRSRGHRASPAISPRAARDSRGRSLRDCDLNRRLFRYPCSYLIYSEAFEALPDPVKNYAYRRLWEILTGKDQSPAYSRLSTDDRQAILEILRDEARVSRLLEGPEFAGETQPERAPAAPTRSASTRPAPRLWELIPIGILKTGSPVEWLRKISGVEVCVNGVGPPPGPSADRSSRVDRGSGNRLYPRLSLREVDRGALGRGP